MKIVYSESLKDFLDNAIDNQLNQDESIKYLLEEFPEIPKEYLIFRLNDRLKDRHILGTLPINNLSK